MSDLFTACFENPWKAAWEPEPMVMATAAPAEVKAGDNAPGDLQQTFTAHGEWIDAMVKQFTDGLKPIVEKAQKGLEESMRRVLDIQNGTIAPNEANQHALDQLNLLFMNQLDAAGYRAFVQAFTEQFAEQLPFLQETIDFLARQAGHKLPAVSFQPHDLRVFTDIAASDIRSTMQAVAAATLGQVTAQRAAFGLAGLPFKEMVKIFQAEFGGSVKRNAARAETAIAVWYRQVADEQYKRIEKEIPSLVQRYIYSGPLDSVTRPFCRHMLTVTGTKPLTRAEIDKLDNGQIPNVFVSCGGWGCRHQWLLWFDAMKDLIGKLPKAA